MLSKYSKHLNDSQSDLPYLSKKMKIKKFHKPACNLYNKKKYLVHIKTLKQALNHGLTLKRVPRVIEFNQKAWLKLQTDINKILSTF